MLICGIEIEDYVVKLRMMKRQKFLPKEFAIPSFMHIATGEKIRRKCSQLDGNKEDSHLSSRVYFFLDWRRVFWHCLDRN